MKRLGSVELVLAPLFFALGCGQSAREPTSDTPACRSIEFADPNVDTAVREALVNAPRTAPLSATDVAPLVMLRVSGAADLGGVECLSGLRDLGLYAPAGASLAPLGRLRLKAFAAYDGSISSVDALGAVDSLEVLILSGESGADLGFVSRLERLATLSVTASSLASVDPLRELTGLQSLVLEGTSVSDLTPLAALPALTTLNISSTQVSELDAIPAPAAGVDLTCLHAENLPLSAHAVTEGIPALCDRGWDVTWSTADGTSSGQCGRSCNK